MTSSDCSPRLHLLNIAGRIAILRYALGNLPEINELDDKARILLDLLNPYFVPEDTRRCTTTMQDLSKQLADLERTARSKIDAPY